MMQSLLLGRSRCSASIAQPSSWMASLNHSSCAWWMTMNSSSSSESVIERCADNSLSISRYEE